MSLQRYIRIGILLFVLTLGVWLIARPSQLRPETAQRAIALRSLSPVGLFGANGSTAVETGQTVIYDPVTPLPRNFADVDPNATHGDSMYERWLRGEIDLDENDGILSAVEIAALKEAAMRSGPTPGVQIAESGPGLRAPLPTGVGFASIDYNGGGGSTPPDPEMAVGPNHIIVVVNVAVAIYDKNGNTLLGPVPAGSLYTLPQCTSGLYDPNVLYDEEADRWIIAFDKGAFSATGGYCLLASQSGNPIGSWNQYFFPLNNAAGWLDYPHAGVGDNFIFMGGNIFTMGGNFVEGRIYAFNKANLYTGAAVSAIARGLTSALDTPQPINLHGASTGTWPNWGNKHYFMAEPYDGINYTLLEWDTVNLTNRGNIAIGTGLFPVDVPQNGGQAITANDWRPLDFEYRNGYGWMTATNGCNPGGGTVNCITWAQINLTTATPGPAGSGTYGSSAQHRFFPDLAVNHCNDMVVGYTKSSSSMFPSVYVTGRQSGDASGQLQAEIEMKAGEIAYLAFDSPPRRWGDYTGMTIDPDGLTFWYLGEYSKNTGNPNGRWGNYIASFTYPSCVVQTNARLAVAHLAPFAMDPGTAVTVTLNGVPALTDFAYGDSTPYLTVPAGTYNVEVYPAGSPTPAISGTFTLTAGTDYSVIAIGDGANRPLSLLALVDDNTAPVAGSAKVRLGHLAPFAAGPALADIRLQDGTPIALSMDFSDITLYVPLPAGTYDLKITTPGGAVTLIDPLPVTLPAGAIVSAFATGEGSNQPLGAFAWPADSIGFFLPLAEYGVALSPATAAQTGAPGEVVTYTLTVTNTGNVTDTFTIALSGNAWVTNAPASIALGAGASGTFVVTVAIPANAGGGESDSVTVTATSVADAAQSAAAELTTTAANVYGLALSPATAAQTGAPGEVVTYTLTVTNTGNVTDTFTIALSGNSWTTNAPASIALGAGASGTVVVTVAIPASAANNDSDSVTVTATSAGDAAVTATSTLTTTAVVTDYILYLPLIIKP